MTHPILQTERLTLRAPDHRDEAAMMEFFQSDFGVYWGGPFGGVEAWNRFSAIVGQWTLRGYGLMSIVLRETEETIGIAGPYHPTGFAEPEMSWLLCNPSLGGKGYAREACEAQIAHEFAIRTWPTMVSFIHVENAPSIALAKRLGAAFDADTKANLPNCITYRHWPEGADG